MGYKPITKGFAPDLCGFTALNVTCFVEWMRVTDHCLASVAAACPVQLQYLQGALPEWCHGAIVREGVLHPHKITFGLL